MNKTRITFLQEVFDEYLPRDHISIEFKLLYNAVYPYYFDTMMIRAITCNNITLCRLLRSWYSFYYYTNTRFINAAVQHDNLRLCRIFVRKHLNDPADLDLNCMICAAARMGNARLCRAAKRWGVCNFNAMLINAASNGQLAICKLAVKWGASNFERALDASMKHGFENVRKYLLDKCLNKPYHYSFQ